MRVFGISRDSPWTHIAWSQTLDLGFPAALRLERGSGARVRRRLRVPRPARRRATLGVPDRRGRYGHRCMALRDGRGARLRRALASRPGFAGLAAGLYTLAGFLATWPALEHVSTHFLAAAPPTIAEATPGDHLQTSWNLWLFGHQLAHLNAPWRDPYSFRPELSPRANFQGLVVRAAVLAAVRAARRPCSRGTSSRC